MAGFVAELIGAVFVGAWLLLFERHHDFGVFFDTLGPRETAATSARSWPPACSASTCSTASRRAATSPRRSRTRPDDPKAMRRTIYIGGAAAIFVTAALILAQPDFNAILSGENADPVGNVFSDVFGVGRVEDRHDHRVDLVRLVPAQPAGRGKPTDVLLRPRPMVFASDALSRFSPTRHVPPIALTSPRSCPPSSWRSPRSSPRALCCG